MDHTYQPLWKCSICSSAGLLDESHVFCPNCGHARDDEQSVFPGWDELVPQATHRFHGAQQRCCNQGWSPLARHCGRCGRALDRTHRAPPPSPLSGRGTATVLALEDLHTHRSLFSSFDLDDLTPQWDELPS